MRIAYFDCYAGISGDMTIAAFINAGLKFDILSRELAKLRLKGYELKMSDVKRNGIAGTKFDCVVKHDNHSHRSLKEITALIDRSRLNTKVKKTAKDIFTTIGNAEAKVHRIKKVEDIHLHELGCVDSIIDIVGTAIAIDELEIDEIYSSEISMGRAIVNSEHGVIPAPAPATLELLKGIPVKLSEIKAELVTPTGAGILKTLVKSFGKPPELKISDIGYGAGSRELKEIPNMLRIMIGVHHGAFQEDKISVIETNLDDMSPQNFEYLFERLFKAGALDVYTTTIQMKKSRPAFKLTVLTDPSSLEKIASIIFSETTSIGVRYYEADRLKLARKIVKVKTKYGNISVKMSSGPDNIRTVSPEYDECVRIARSKNIPLKKVYEEARMAVKV